MNIDEYIRSQILALKSGQATLDSVVATLSISLCSWAKVERTSDIEMKIRSMLLDYQNNNLDEEKLFNYLHEISTGNVNIDYTPIGTGETPIDEGGYYGGGSYSGGSSGSSSSASTKEDVATNFVVNYNTDMLQSVSDKYTSVETELSSIKLEVPTAVANYVGNIKTVIEAGKADIEENLTKLKSEVVEVLNIGPETDDSVADIELGKIKFEHISKVIYDRKQNSRVVEADAEFFRQNGCKVDGDIVTLNVKGKEYKYDLSKKMFYINGANAFSMTDKEAAQVRFFIPSGNRNYSKLNTYTCFTNKGTVDNINNQSTNSIIMNIQKFPVKMGFNKYSETADVTRFMNAVAKTDLSSGKCRNIISGDSVYGAHSLQIAAESGDLYQTVYCVNNAVIVTGENGTAGNKTQFSSLADLSKLDGKDIYFISVTGDPNFNKNRTTLPFDSNKTCPYNEGYTYTGLKLICETCPNAKIHMVYNEGNHPKITNLLTGLGDKYSNYSYEGSNWELFASKKFNDHSKGEYIVIESINGEITNYNGYSA